jgi:hypothetical protein
MRYAPDRAGGQFDLAASVHACPMCLGDLIPRADAAGYTYVCIQCRTTIAARGRPIRALPTNIVPSLSRHVPPVQAA